MTASTLEPFASRNGLVADVEPVEEPPPPPLGDDPPHAACVPASGAIAAVARAPRSRVRRSMWAVSRLIVDPFREELLVRSAGSCVGPEAGCRPAEVRPGRRCARR